MHFFALSIFTLGLVCASAQDQEDKGNSSNMTNISVSTMTYVTNVTTNLTQNDNATTDSMPTPSMNGSGVSSVPSARPATPHPARSSPPILEKATPTKKNQKKDIVTTPASTRPKPVAPGRRLDRTGITIISLVVLILLIVAVVFLIRRKYQKRYSVDLRTEAASVPLSVVVDHNEPDNGNANGMQTADKGQVDSKESPDSGNNGVPKPKDSGPAEVPQPKESGPAEVPQTKDSGPAEVPKPKDSGAAEVPKPKDSGAAEVPKPKDSGLAEVPQPMAEQNDQAEHEGQVEAVATAQLASTVPVEAGPLEGATDDEGIASNKTSADTLKDPSESTGSNIQTEASATDSLLENFLAD